MNTVASALFSVNIQNDFVEKRDISQQDAIAYNKKLIEEILGNRNRQLYKIRDKRTHVVSTVLNAVKNKALLPEDAESIAQRLLDKERERQEEVDRLNVQIKQGSLLLSLVRKGNDYLFAIVKVESNDYLDEEETRRRSGLPYENKSFKQCLFQIDGSTLEITDAFLYDRNGAIADYWANEFLELDVLTSDEVNTLDTFGIITNILKRKVERISPADYTLFRNQTLGYYQTSEWFNLDDFYEHVFGTYTSDNKDIDIPAIKNEIGSKIENAARDTSFQIKKNVIKARKLKETRQVNPTVAVTVDGYDDEIKTNIRSQELNGEKYILVRATDEKAYQSFLWSER